MEWGKKKTDHEVLIRSPFQIRPQSASLVCSVCSTCVPFDFVKKMEDDYFGRPIRRPKSYITPEEFAEMKKEEFRRGPFSLLFKAVQNKKTVLISLRNNKKLFARVTAFDRHFNMILENVREMWTEEPRKDKGQQKNKPVNKDRFISKMFLRGDSVILIVENAMNAEPVAVPNH